MDIDQSMVPTSEGAGPGDSGDDVRRVQRYLERFGYVDSPVLREFGVRTDLAEPAPTKLGDFDDNTRRALQKLQERYGLEPTGRVDGPTLELMKTQRCGFPDTAEFVLQGNKWNATSLRYGFQNFCGDISQAECRAAVQAGLGYWSAVTPLRFAETAVSDVPEIVIRFVADDHGDGSAFDGKGGVLAHAFYPPPNGGSIAGDAHFDEDEGWSVNTPPSGIDLYTVAGHEFGHALGLAHSTVRDALMYPYYGGPHRHLAQDDIQGIQQLYGVLQWVTSTVDRVFTSPHARNAWAYLHEVGAWRKVQPLSADGVTNVHAILVYARAYGLPVTAQLNDSEILAVYL